MANQNIETVTSAADKAKVALAIAAVILGVVGFYILAEQATVIRVGSVLLGMLVGAGIAYTSGPGQRFFAFAKDSWGEARRVVWPSKKETTQMTMIVFVFVVIMAIFLWLVDQGLQWLLYDAILGWK
ncbi:MAG: preprotein translocase subunit SecE [Burkholderiaceae bacterium]